MSNYLYTIGVYLLYIVSASNGDICSTCVCSGTDAGPVINCHDKNLGSNNILNFDLLMLDEHRMLNELIFSRNNITVLPGDIFKKLKRLRSLDLSQNSVEEIHPTVFSGLDKLHDLNLSNNQLKKFDDMLLQALPTLSKLNLSRNNISTIEHTATRNAEKIIILDLSHNRLSELNPDFFLSLPNLESLDLSFNDLRSIDENRLINLPSLKILLINNNRLTSLSLQQLPGPLIELHCGFNLIKKMSYAPSKIEFLNIQYNRLAEVDKNITLLSRLRQLNVSGNELIEFPNVVYETLEILDLSMNKFPKVPECLSIRNFPRLMTLNISSNPIRNIIFSSELELHNLVANDISMLEKIDRDAFLNLRTPQNGCINLTISGNSMLSQVHEEALKHLNVCYLDLSYNHISDISQKLIGLGSDFQNYAVNLQGNPFHCSCELQWMVNVLVPKLFSTRPSLLEDLRCASPPQISNVRMVHWYKWKEQIFCMDMSEPLEYMTAAVMNSESKFVMIKSSPGLLIAVIASIALLVILVIGGLLLTMRMSLKKRRRNRRL